MKLLYQNEQLQLDVANFPDDHTFDFKVSRDAFVKSNAVRTLKLIELGKDYLSARMGYQTPEEQMLRDRVSAWVVEKDDGSKVDMKGFFFDNINFTTRLHSEHNFDELLVNMSRLAYKG